MLATLLDLVLPLTCPGCAAPQRWCTRCAAPLTARPRRLSAALADLSASPPVYALAGYDGPVRAAILAAKEHGRRDLPALLGVLLGRALLRLLGIQVLSGPLWLVPAPTRRATARTRGGDPITVMARAAATVLVSSGRPAGVAPCLYTAGTARDSVGLDPAQRRSNLAGRLRWRARAGPPRSLAVILVDDVFTTGATAACATELLVASGHAVQSVVTLAAATRWFQPSSSR